MSWPLFMLLWIGIAMVLGPLVGAIIRRLDRPPPTCVYEVESDGQRIRYEGRTPSELMEVRAIFAAAEEASNGQ